ncbi:hypothetical protein [Pseudonocardia sp. N23]|uniref:hypothetical protein n=1 Tax=Pseudonocardia sp. N23 TaxID=1987376 RepID=UPI0011458338|nr:hypothetical protein [Pseudonocardia sp. N23]
MYVMGVPSASVPRASHSGPAPAGSVLSTALWKTGPRLAELGAVLLPARAGIVDAATAVGPVQDGAVGVNSFASSSAAPLCS